MRLSQGQLNLLETCPPQFQRVYLDRLATPASLEQLEKQNWGSQFHLLMQQRELGLPINSLLTEDSQLNHSIEALLNAAPEILRQDDQLWREAEHCRTLNFLGNILTVIYDLLIVQESRLQIIDWKTYLEPANQAKLRSNWQTRLYPFVLAETSSYLPERIEMTYWFVKLPKKPQSVTFKYSSSQHERTRQDLTNLIAQLDRYLQDYFDRDIPFPHLPTCHENCPYYKSIFATDESVSALNNENHFVRTFHGTSLKTAIADIEEISI